MRGRKAKPSAQQAGHLPEQLPRASQHHAVRHAFDGAETDPRPNQITQHQPEAQRADVEESRRQRRHAELIARVQNSHGLRRQRHQQQKWEHDARQFHRQLKFSGNGGKPWREHRDQRRTEDHAQHAQHSHHQQQRRCYQVRKLGGFLLPFCGKVFGEDRHEGRGQRALGEQIAREVRNAEAEKECVVDLAGAEQAGHGDLANEPRDAAQKDSSRNHSRRPHQALVFRIRGSGSGLGRCHVLVHLPDFNTLINVLGLRRTGKLHPWKAGGSGTGGNTPAQRVAIVLFQLHRPGKCGGQSVSGADRRNGIDTRGDDLDHLMVEGAHGALASKGKNHRFGAHFPDARGRLQEVRARQAVAVSSNRSASCWLGVTTVGLASIPAASASPSASNSVFTPRFRAIVTSCA